MSETGRQALWARLSEAGLVEGPEPPRVLAGTPWFVRIMLGIAGWIGALFLLGFVGVGFASIMESAAASFILGAITCTAAAMLFRANPHGGFVGQFGLAISVAGQALIGFALIRWFEGSFTTIAVAIALMQVVLFALIGNFIHRVWSAWMAAVAATWALGNLGLPAFALAMVTFAFVWIWLAEFDHPRRSALVQAAGYGLAIAIIQTIAMDSAPWSGLVFGRGTGKIFGGETSVVIGKLISGTVLIWVMLKILRREGVDWRSGAGRVALAGALILAIVSWKAPGVGPATLILVIGFANGNRVLAGLGVVALLGYLSHYYYVLHATLLEKSVLLAVSGIVLLTVRFAIRRWWPREPRHA